MYYFGQPLNAVAIGDYFIPAVHAATSHWITSGEVIMRNPMSGWREYGSTPVWFVSDRLEAMQPRQREPSWQTPPAGSTASSPGEVTPVQTGREKSDRAPYSLTRRDGDSVTGYIAGNQRLQDFLGNSLHTAALRTGPKETYERFYHLDGLYVGLSYCNVGWDFPYEYRFWFDPAWELGFGLKPGQLFNKTEWEQAWSGYFGESTRITRSEIMEMGDSEIMQFGNWLEAVLFPNRNSRDNTAVSGFDYVESYYGKKGPPTKTLYQAARRLGFPDHQGYPGVLGCLGLRWQAPAAGEPGRPEALPPAGAARTLSVLKISLDKVAIVAIFKYMIAVGVRDLKNQLSQYLQYVKNGEKVVITEHNRVIAEISSPVKKVSNNDIEIELEKLTAAGKLIKAKRNNSIQLKTEASPGIDWISVYQENRDS